MILISPNFDVSIMIFSALTMSRSIWWPFSA